MACMLDEMQTTKAMTAWQKMVLRRHREGMTDAEIAIEFQKSRSSVTRARLRAIEAEQSLHQLEREFLGDTPIPRRN